MIYYITLEVRTKTTLNEDQQDKLRDAVLKALDVVADRIPYKANVVTASLSREES